MTTEQIVAPDIKERSLCHLWSTLQFFVDVAEGNGYDLPMLVRDMKQELAAMPKFWASEGRDWEAEKRAMWANIRQWQNAYRRDQGLPEWPAEEP